MLELQGVSKAFGGHRAVDGLSLSIERGRITGLIGPNGAGKTTLFNLIAGAMKPTEGRILLDGTRIDGLRADRIFKAGLARTFQIPRPFPEMTVLDNVLLAPAGQLGESVLRAWLTPGAVRAQERRLRDRAMACLDFVGLARLAQDPARVLSGGQRKLLELARVLVAEPSVILFDEPGAGVAPALLDTIVEKIAALNRDGVTILIIEHNMDLVMGLCDPVVVMAQGRLLIQGRPQAVQSDPRVIEAYLGGVAA
ncbi:branched-chain amino acid transport system ATP-binding protein [Inquilinus ginsengisoli]|uniref:Branched-chain amino acid transport system ATP-binding protein n=1 Tax=Inquilinus ginsengisoli TaxID=363840 RepID=A0ABU1JKN5_9PROT|nr:ABC transporter ATP-binding protein [Inquilinus ginsengisoli]MDR6289160.1 branched-chain amino acid transport system ATP-binding protein [Inquilinus ginsengisoli]